MRYQVLAKLRKLKLGDKPFDLIVEFNDLFQLYYMMDKVDKNKYSEILVIDANTNEVVASRDIELYEPYTKKRRLY